MRGFTTIDLGKMRTRGEGVQNLKNFADVLYEWSLKENTFVDVAMARYQLIFNGHSKVKTFFNSLLLLLLPPDSGSSRGSGLTVVATISGLTVQMQDAL